MQFKYHQYGKWSHFYIVEHGHSKVTPFVESLSQAQPIFLLPENAGLISVEHKSRIPLGTQDFPRLVVLLV
jgi:hypothetical protein